MPVSLAQHNAVGSGSATLAYASAQTAGNLNIVGIVSAVAVTGVSDTKNGSYTLAATAAHDTTNGTFISIYYVNNIASALANANTVTVAGPGAANMLDLFAIEVSGLSSLGTLLSAINSGTSVTPTITINSVANGSFIFWPVIFYAGGPGTPSNCTLIDSPNDQDYYLITTSAGNETLSTGGTATFYSQAVAFQPAGGTITLPSTTMQGLFGISTAHLSLGIPLTWDSNMSLWDSPVVNWQAGQPLTWDSPVKLWNDPIGAWDMGNVEWDGLGKWDDQLLVWDPGASIEWDSRDINSTWDSPSAVWDVGNITWDNLKSNWSDPLIAWDAAAQKQWDSAVTYWDSTIDTWDAGATIITLPSTTMQGLFGIKPAPTLVYPLGTVNLQAKLGITPAPQLVYKLPGTTMQGLFGIKPAPQLVYKLPFTTLQARFGISTVTLVYELPVTALQARFGITPTPQLVMKLASATLQARLGITAATVVMKLGTVTMQSNLGITTAKVTAVLPGQMAARLGITNATLTGGGGVTNTQETLFGNQWGISRAIVPPVSDPT
jgi:hypothetical protein